MTQDRNPRKRPTTAIALYDAARFSHTEQVALAGSRAAGCTCNPDIEITHDPTGIEQATVRHDPWCALLRAGDVN